MSVQEIELSQEFTDEIFVLTHMPEIRHWCLKEWAKFEHALLCENRFSAENIFLDAVREKAGKATKTIERGTILYRARIFEQEPVDKFLFYMQKVLKREGNSVSAFLRSIEMQVDNWLALLPQKDDGEPYVKQAREATRLMRQARFRGYNAKDSTAPPSGKCISYRANPDHIRYLYVSEDRETPIYEIRPSIWQYVSLAKLKSNRDLKLYDLSVESDAFTAVAPSTIQVYGAIMFVCGMFSQPNYNEPSKYLPTQYIAETIKRMGFDGIRYISSLHKDGTNIVLFNPNDCRVISSDLVRVNGIQVNYETAFLYNEKKE